MVEVYDIETYKYAFIFCSYNIHTKTKVDFEISERKTDIKLILKHLKSIKGQIGYNNLRFDYPVLHWIVKNHKKYKDSLKFAHAIHEYANGLFKSESPYQVRENLTSPKQLDLYRIWHFDNKNRSTSLKWLEFAMRMMDIEDLPYEVDQELTSEMIDDIIEYCYHDVEATYQFYLKSIEKIELRKKLQGKYKTNLINKSDVGIAETLVLNSYCYATGLETRDVREMRSTYKFIHAKDVIFSQIKFQTPELQDWLVKLKETYLLTPGGTWGGTEITVKGEVYDIKLGGIHIQQKALAHITEKGEYIAELDCAGMYPTFIAKHGQYPAHLGQDFLTLYRQIRDDRMAAKKSGDKVMDAAGKLMGNGTFGLDFKYKQAPSNSDI